jgi:hypothetical protein
MSTKEIYHTFESDNRKAEVFVIWPNKWLVECLEDNKLSHSKEVANESAAELYADDWVLKNESKGISN